MTERWPPVHVNCRCVIQLFTQGESAVYNGPDMGKKKGTQLKIQDWTATPYYSLSLSEGIGGLNWHTVFLCDRCKRLFSRLDKARVLKKAKPRTPGKKVVSAPPDIPLYCDSCSQEQKGKAT